jgi:putative membrane-bound dehydrogenase-like protein
MRFATLWLLLVAFCSVDIAAAADGNRLAYLDECDPYYPHRDFPRLTTPQWYGEPGVEAVVILAIDDMRDTAKYEAFLRPILDRLKQIDGQARISIMANEVDPNDPQLQVWHKEGVSIECHTLDHPCPLLTGGDFAKAKATYDDCVDLISAIPHNAPVAFRMPCCDSLNTVSPRFFAEIFAKPTPKGRQLRIDSSVFNLLTADDPALPRELICEPGSTRGRFEKYLPFPSFANTIENYPYPYLIGGNCWEFPCVVPSDWEAQNIQQPNNPKTVEDLKAALDCVVIKQGVFPLVFHPHGWIRAEQIVELIDHAVAKHGKKVRFISFADAADRLDPENSPRVERTGPWGEHIRHVLDIDHDGLMDWFAESRSNERETSFDLAAPKNRTLFASVAPTVRGEYRFGVLDSNGRASALVHNERGLTWLRYTEANELPQFEAIPFQLADKSDATLNKLLVPNVAWLDHRLRDLDGDGICELLITSKIGDVTILALNKEDRWRRLPFTLPEGTAIVDSERRDAGFRFIDIDEDGDLDALFANDSRFSLHLFESMETGWLREILKGKPGDEKTISPIVRDGTNNGAWFHSRTLWVQNEDTARMPDLVDRRTFNELLGGVELGLRSAEASLKGIDVRPGLKVELVAAEPLVMDPVAFDWGPDGKLWVVEMGDYPLGVDGHGSPGGRVRYLEDTDGDGKYDRSTLFLDGLSYPNGVMAWGRGVLVSAAPEVFYAEDTDGDGRADKRESLITGFGEANPQHRVNGFTWGLGNWVHCAMGESGAEIQSAKTGARFNFGNRDFRFRPETGEVDPQTGVTQYQRIADDWGHWFGSDNIHPLWHFCLPDEYLRRNPHVAAPRVLREVPENPGAAPVFPTSRTLARFNDFHLSNHITSACGVTIYRDDLLGADLYGNSFVCEPVHNLIHREVLAPDGPSFTSRRAPEEAKSEFLTSTDNWFRPVMIRTGPDGALYFADYYRQVLEHPEWIPDDIEAKMDLRAGHDRGRIYRIVPVGAPLRTVPKLSEQTTAELVQNLTSKNGTLRDMTQRLLVERGDKSDVAPLQKLAIEGERPLTRLQSLCTLEGLRSLDETTVAAALSDVDADVRAHALRLSEPFLKGENAASKAVREPRWLEETNPQLRLQYACTVGHLPPAEAAKRLAPMLIRDWNEEFTRAALMSSLNAESLRDCALALLAPEQRKSAPSELLNSLPDLALAFEDRKTCAAILDAALTSDDPGLQLSIAAATLRALRQRDQNWSGLFSDETQANAALTALNKAAATAFVDESADLNLRLAALEIVSQLEDASSLEQIAVALTPAAPEELREAAIERLADMESDAAFDALLAPWRSFTPQVRGRALDACFQRPEQLPRVLAALEAGQIQPSDFDADRRQRFAMRASGALRDRVVKALSAEVETDRRQVVEQFQDVLQLTTNAERGAEVFRAKCAVCHRLGETGHAVGADLAALTDKSPAAQLIAILDPNRALETKFVNYAAQTTDGLTHTGMLVEESGASITLLGQEEKRVVIPRGEIEACESTGKSLMPEGLEKDLTKQDLADVMAFVANIPTPHKVFPGNEPAVVSADDTGALKLTAVRAEVFGPTLVFEQLNQNLGFWGSEADRAAWNMTVDRPGKFRVWLHYACHDDTANNPFVVRCGEQQLRANVIGTGTWDYYRREPLGDLTLTAGPHRVILHSEGPIAGHLMDLFELSLEPVAAE